MNTQTPNDGYVSDQAKPITDAVLDELILTSEALNADCRFDEADRSVADAMRARPNDARTAAQLTLLALQRGDWRGAADRAAALRLAFPDEQAGYRGGIEATTALLQIAKAADLLKVAAGRFSDEPWTLAQAAVLAEVRQNFTDAESRRAEFCQRFPAEPAGWRDWAATRMRAGRLEAAVQVITEALQKFPDEVDLYNIRAQIAARSGRREETEEWLRLASERFASDPEIAQRHAEAPVEFNRHKRWDIARSRYEDLNRKYPEYVQGHVRHIMLLVRAGDLDRAEELARSSGEVFRASGQHADIIVELARILDRRGDAAGAVSLLRDLQEEAPNAISGYVMLSTVLSRQSLFDEAETACRRAISRFKFRAPPYIEYAKIASLRGDLDVALQRWKRAYYFVPREPIVDSELFITRLALTESTATNTKGDLFLEIGRQKRSGPLTNAMMQFESLGAPGGGGCEFGLVQRNFGAEPIGLLRWATLSTMNLVKALRERFEGLGTREQTKLSLPGLDNNLTQYYVNDTRFDIGMHTWVMRDETVAEKLLEQWCVRLQFLRRKLIADLESGGKIFVCRPGAVLTDSEIGQLGSAVRGYGDNKLLLIQIQKARNPSGSVKWVSAGVMAGYIDRLNWEPGQTMRQPSYASWARICVNALALAAQPNV